jgi:hypothetical protein
MNIFVFNTKLNVYTLYTMKNATDISEVDANMLPNFVWGILFNLYLYTERTKSQETHSWHMFYLLKNKLHRNQKTKKQC